MTTLIDCDFGIIRIEAHGDGCLFTLMTPSIHDDDTHQPAESASTHLGGDDIRQLVSVLSGILVQSGTQEH